VLYYNSIYSYIDNEQLLNLSLKYGVKDNHILSPNIVG